MAHSVLQMVECYSNTEQHCLSQERGSCTSLYSKVKRVAEQPSHESEVAQSVLQMIMCHSNTR